LSEWTIVPVFQWKPLQNLSSSLAAHCNTQSAVNINSLCISPSIGRQSFPIAVSIIWNTLPAYIY